MRSARTAPASHGFQSASSPLSLRGSEWSCLRSSAVRGANTSRPGYPGTPPSPGSLRRMRKYLPLIPLGAAAAALGWALKEAGLPSSYLFAALLVGLAVALWIPDRVEMPRAAFIAGQAMTGVVLGAF